MTSHNPNDEREGFCGNCHAYTGARALTDLTDQLPSDLPSDAKVKVINLVTEGTVLPPAAPNVCQLCERDHEPEQPHNRDNLGYQYRFYHDHARWPTWADAMAHCAPEVQQAWKQELAKHGVPAEQLTVGA